MKLNPIKRKQVSAIRTAQDGVMKTKANWTVFIRENGNYFAKMARVGDQNEPNYLCTITDKDLDIEPLAIAANLGKYRLDKE